MHLFCFGREWKAMLQRRSFGKRKECWREVTESVRGSFYPYWKGGFKEFKEERIKKIVEGKTEVMFLEMES